MMRTGQKEILPETEGDCQALIMDAAPQGPCSDINNGYNSAGGGKETPRQNLPEEKGTSR